MLKTFANAWKLPDLRKKMIFTFVIIVLYRIGCVLPVPFIDTSAIQNWFSTSASGTMLQYFNILSGNSFSKATLFALSVSPYITASIVIQLLTVAIPALERMSKDGEEGKKKLTQITRYTTVGIALLTSYGYYVTLNSSSVNAIVNPGWFSAIVIVACHCAGAALIMWLAEKNNESGIGNGISIILFANIISSLPTMVTGFVDAGSGWNFKNVTQTILIYALFLAIGVAIVAFVVFMTESERRLPVQYAKRVVGRKMYGGQSTFLPIKLNMSGVMPIIFASSILMLPATIAMFFKTPEEGTFWYGFLSLFSTTSISFNPVEVANNLKKNGGFIPGLRPGKPTSDFISNSLKKITLIGAFFLGFIAVVPMIINIISSLVGGVDLGSVTFGGTSMLIVVGVVLETVRDLQSQITMRHYKGFLG